MADEVLPGNVMVDCHNEQPLQEFYGGLLGWERFRLSGRPAVRSASGVGSLFAEESDDLRSTWPKQPGKQQNQMHFDFRVDDVAEMVKKAEAPGAQKAAAQFGGWDFATMPGPAGHPFCLCRKGRSGQHNLKAAF